MPCPRTEISIQQSETLLAVTITGELNGRMADTFEDLVERAGSLAGRSVRLDLSGLEILDASGLPGILAVQQATWSQGGPFGVTVSDGKIAATLEAAGVQGVVLL